jgi:uncharacterized repeat protein (TIGR03803 family)
MKRTIMMRTIYAAALVALFAASAYASGSPFSAVYTFACNGGTQRIGTCPNGGRPEALIQGSDGNFYGTAQVSMEGISEPNGGVVFSLAPAGTQKVLHTFTQGPDKNYPDGNIPGPLSEGPDGKLYGVTDFGGNPNCSGYCGNGVLYRINRDGSGFTVLHKFCSETDCADGEYPGAMVTGTDGNVYGTTQAGGTGGSCSGDGCGTLFRVTPSTAAYEVVVNFTDTDGGVPSNLVVASDGTFYGIALGTTAVVLFHYTEATGTLQSFSVSFPLIDGDLPSAPLMMTLGPNGNVYGLYGVYAENGAGVFEVDPDGTNLQLFPFYTTNPGRGTPYAMIPASDGNFWVADESGIDGKGYGDIIALSPTDGSLIHVLQPFSPASALGVFPATLIQASNGLLWGSTIVYGKASAGHFGDGTVFSLNAGLPPK